MDQKRKLKRRDGKGCMKRKRKRERETSREKKNRGGKDIIK